MIGSGDDDDAASARYERAVERISSNEFGSGNVPSEILLQLYGLYSRVSKGRVEDDAAGVSWMSRMDPRASAKREAWAACSALDVPQAMHRYVQLVDLLDAMKEQGKLGSSSDAGRSAADGGMGKSAPQGFVYGANGENHQQEGTVLPPGSAEAALFESIELGDVSRLHRLLKQAPDAKELANCRDGYGMTALMRAADAGVPKMCSVLLDHGAELLDRDEQQQTALHVACICGHARVVRLLLTYAHRYRRHVCSVGFNSLPEEMLMQRDLDGRVPAEYAESDDAQMSAALRSAQSFYNTASYWKQPRVLINASLGLGAVLTVAYLAYRKLHVLASARKDALEP
ncbi:Acyl-CoA-binding domain-containing protein 2 [Porphyridium purpureum]|uniref:Acyl-CoA-binding domain-containing protein 2 n=1 Tax=Porphyridium purpureum TaxID=35688 RepID=A0A5J4YMA1_PORPP|nr:Acyl-CoA-binding domain-containing protein 2 [Porphyridium purpureum]|eukprot:POR7135..scf249_10